MRSTRRSFNHQRNFGVFCEAVNPPTKITIDTNYITSLTRSTHLLQSINSTPYAHLVKTKKVAIVKTFLACRKLSKKSVQANKAGT